MKKLLAIALIAVSFVACNEGEKTTTTETTTTDTTTIVATPDTMQVIADTTVKTTVTVDTTKK